eukprot:TRINITY_DN103262_c0_g1_i3.p1 TRINITY_DN103262_c0_g1~~TRINITY_DN103262_c0_g1_i3.p1  ORF type:complete len:271 (-),score=34.67 TRINITY_DN103262_c0_g1_i3:235-1047(-)
MCVWFAREKNQNFGFIEFASIEDADRAIALDGFLCVGVPIRISRPNDYTQSAGDSGNLAQLAMLSAQELQSHFPASTALGMPATFNQHTGLLQGSSLMGGTDNTAAVKIAKVFNDEEVEGDGDYEDVLADMRDGCSEHGTVQSGLIVTPHIKNKYGATALPFDVGDCFIQLSNVQEAMDCIEKLNGRKYDERPICLSLLDQLLWGRSVHPVVMNEYLISKMAFYTHPVAGPLMPPPAPPPPDEVEGAKEEKCVGGVLNAVDETDVPPSSS